MNLFVKAIANKNLNMRQPLYKIGDSVSVASVVNKNGAIITTEYDGYIGEIRAKYWEKDYYQSGYKFEYAIYASCRFTGNPLSWVSESIIERAGEK
jgi:hypothetical protein